MTYLADLAPYSYNSYVVPNALSIGWLSRTHTFPRGSIPVLFAHELRRLAANPVELTRGHHVCEFCTPPADILAMDPDYRWVWEMYRSGNGEVHITSDAGIT